MDAAVVIALVTVVVSPASALVAVWLTSRLGAEKDRRAQQNTFRTEALSAVSSFMGLVVDSAPGMVTRGDLREYASPQEAVSGLYERWKVAREPMVLLSLSHPSDAVRTLAFRVQEYEELVLRNIDSAVKAGRTMNDPDRQHQEVIADIAALGRYFLPFDGEGSRRARRSEAKLGVRPGWQPPQPQAGLRER
jgi:hypothetical protein